MIDIQPVLMWLEELPTSAVIRESSWGFPTVESVHVLAITLVVGSIAIVDLRLLGLASKRKRVTELTGEILPWTWGLFVVAVISGLIMFSAKAEAYMADTPFKLKLLLLAAAGLNMVAFHALTLKSVDRWDGPAPTPFGAKLAGAISLSLWVLIVAAGRWIGFTIIG